MLEFSDFLRDLRKAVGTDRSITVATATVEGSASVATTEDDRPWRHAVQSMGDPWLTHRTLHEETG